MDTTAVVTEDSNAALAAEIEATVRAVAGVRSVYRAGSLVSNAIGAGAVALGVASRDEPLVAVVPGAAGLQVHTSIGIDFSGDAGEILRSVHEAIDALLVSQSRTRDRITITVVYVQSREAS